MKYCDQRMFFSVPLGLPAVPYQSSERSNTFEQNNKRAFSPSGKMSATSDCDRI
jgi:hypothetical protein